GREALARAAEHTPDVILMDIQLPDMSGEVTLARLRSVPGTAHIPVIALTAFAMREDRERLLAAGFDGYIAKPIDIMQFPEQVRGFCSAGTKDQVVGRARILVVDDTKPNIKLLEAILVPAGYSVVPATSGVDALQAIAQQPIDLVLLDILMPGMDGY